MSLIVRIDVDRPYGRAPFVRHIASRISSDYYLPRIRRLGYLRELGQMLQLLTERSAGAHVFFRQCTLPSPEVVEAIDRGRVSWDDRISMGRGDLTLFHQPIATKILGNGGYTTTLGELMFQAITKSDNTANDKLMRSVGGPDAVRSFIARHNITSVRFYDGERALQSKIAGLIWSQSYSIGDAFYKARNALPLRVRKAAFDRYIEDPYDGASPTAIVSALARLKRGELLSPSSTARLLSIMGNTKTGANRLKGGLRPGWSLSHKTGTGQVLGSVQAGYNDIGILTAPDGRSYAVAVMIKRTSTPLAVRMTLMNNVVRAVIDSHASQGTPYTL